MLYYLYVGTGVKELRGWMMAEITGVFATHKILSAIPGRGAIGLRRDSNCLWILLDISNT